MCVSNTDKLLALVARKEKKAKVLSNIDVVNQAQSTAEAIHLVQLGARASMVCQLTGLTKNVVRGLYQPLTGMPSPSGQVPFTDTWYIRSPRRLLHANVVWRLFQHLGKMERTVANVHIHVYKAYVEIVDTPVLNLTRVSFVPTLVRINSWYEQTCEHCGMSYIGPLDKRGSTCPACTEYFKHRCRSCGVTLERRTTGRRKTLCPDCYEQQRKIKRRLADGVING